jgi:RNA polymerase primary sigma factor
MRNIIEEYEEEFGFKPSQKEVAELLGVNPKTLQSLIKSSASAVSLEGAAFKSDRGSDRQLHEILLDENARDPGDEIDRQRLEEAIREALSDLSPREETVLRLRFGISEPDL